MNERYKVSITPPNLAFDTHNVSVYTHRMKIIDRPPPGHARVAYLLKDGIREGDTTFLSSAETASLVLNQLMPQHVWSTEYVVVPKPKPIPPPPGKEPPSEHSPEVRAAYKKFGIDL